MMKKILVMPDGNFLAHTTRPFEIAKKLRELGYEIVFAGKGQYMKLPKEAGFQVLDIKTIEPEKVLECIRRTRCNFYNYSLVKELVEAELHLFEQILPDLVLTDFRLPLSTSCELAGIKLVSILNSVWTNFYSAKGRAPEHLAATGLLGKRITTLVMPWIERIIIANDVQPFHKYRKEIGLKPRKNIWDYCKGDLTLIADIPEYGPTKNLPENFFHIGPILWEPEIETPEWIRDLDADRSTIYFTMGSTGNPEFFKQAIEIFGDSTYQCIMTTGGMNEISKIPENFYIADYLPGREIMRKSDVVVCHGGNGTIYQAMSCGVPIIGIPTWVDQEYNLQRVEDMGIGIQLSELRFKPEHLVKAVEDILAQESYNANARHYKTLLSEYNSTEMAANLISSLLSET